MARVGRLPTLRDCPDEASKRLAGRLRHQGLEYLERHDDLFILDDYSLRVKKDITLRCASDTIDCLQTGWTSSGESAEAEDVGFDVMGPRDRIVFALLLDDRPTDKSVLVALLPPLKRRETIKLTIKWEWPGWWSSLRDTGTDRVLVNLATPAKLLTVTLRCSVGICSRRKDRGTLSVSPNVGQVKSPSAAGSNIKHVWTYSNPKDGRYELSFKF